MRCDEVVMWLTTHFHFSHFFLKTNWSTINSIHTDLIWSLIWSASPDPDRFVHWFWSDPFRNVWSWSVLENLKSFMIGFGKFEIEMIALGKIEAARKFEERSAKIFAARTGANKNKMKEKSERIATRSTRHSSLGRLRTAGRFRRVSAAFQRIIQNSIPKQT